MCLRYPSSPDWSSLRKQESISTLPLLVPLNVNSKGPMEPGFRGILANPAKLVMPAKAAIHGLCSHLRQKRTSLGRHLRGEDGATRLRGNDGTGISRRSRARGFDPATQHGCATLSRHGGSAAKAVGFTLVELMVVIVIIGLLATMVMVNVMPSQDRAMVEKARADVSVLEQALETYRLDNLVYPRTDQGLDTLLQPPPNLVRPDRYRRGGYVRRLPEDPWGNAYQYRQPGREGPFDVYSLGADGAEGGQDDNADIGNWR